MGNSGVAGSGNPVTVGNGTPGDSSAVGSVTVGNGSPVTVGRGNVGAGDPLGDGVPVGMGVAVGRSAGVGVLTSSCVGDG